MNEVWLSVRDWIGGLHPIEMQVIGTIVTIVVLWAIRYGALRMVQSHVEDPHALYRWRKTLSYLIVIIGFIAVSRIWFQAFGSLGTFFGLVSAGLAIALRDPIVNIAGWLFIVWRRPFRVGDRVQLGELRGDVIDIRIFQFSILEIGNWVNADQSTGRIIHVPNGLVFRESQANYGQAFEFIWNELPIAVTFESDWRKAKDILSEISTERAENLSEQAQKRIREAAKEYLIFYQHLTPIVFTSVVDFGVLLTVRYLCNPRKRRSSAQAIWEDVLDRFAEHDDIDFAYPTYRLYDNPTEGKPGARAELDGAKQGRS